MLLFTKQTQRLPYSSTATMSASILTLPPELLSQSLKKSDYASRLALRYTSKHLYLQISTTFALGSTAAQHSNTSHNISDLQVEKWPCYDLAGQGDGHLRQPLATRDFFACSLCLKIRCASRFSNAMMKGKRGKHPAVAFIDKDQKRKRFCIDCGVRYGKYRPGVIFEIRGARICVMEHYTTSEAAMDSGETPTHGSPTPKGPASETSFTPHVRTDRSVSREGRRRSDSRSHSG